MRIDVHAHVVLADALGGTLSDAGFEVGGYLLQGVRYAGTPFLDPDLRLQRMDDVGIDLQVLSPNPLVFAAAPPEFCRRHNDALAALVQAHPDRLQGLALLPLPDVPAAVAELRRTTPALLGAYIGTDPGRPLDAPEMDALYETCVELDVPLFVHPTPVPGRDPRLARWDLELTVGFGYDETLAVATLVHGGVLDRHPALDVCVSHGGGAAAMLHGRMRKAEAVRAWGRGADAFDADFRRLWFDSHVASAAALDVLLAVCGPDRVVYGTNFAGWDSGATVPPASPAPEQLTANARRLLRL